jgi:hypothetical protein
LSSINTRHESIYIYIYNVPWILSFHADLSTPIHQNSEILEVETPNLINKSKVKQLIELFHESFNADESGEPLEGQQHLHYGSEAESSVSDLPANRNPYDLSVANLVSGARTRNTTQFAHCFLPKLVQILRFSDQRKRC